MCVGGGGNFTRARGTRGDVIARTGASLKVEFVRYGARDVAMLVASYPGIAVIPKFPEPQYTRVRSTKRLAELETTAARLPILKRGGNWLWAVVGGWEGIPANPAHDGENK